jgi:hypothetical protein
MKTKMSYYDYVESTCKVRVKPSHLPNQHVNWKTLYIWNMDPEFVWKKPKFEELRPLESCKEEFNPFHWTCRGSLINGWGLFDGIKWRTKKVKQRWNEFYQNPSGYDVVVERNRIEWLTFSSENKRPPRTAKIYPIIPEGKELDEDSGEGIVQFSNSTTFEADLDEINTWVNFPFREQTVPSVSEKLINNNPAPITRKHVIYNWIMSFWK